MLGQPDDYQQKTQNYKEAEKNVRNTYHENGEVVYNGTNKYESLCATGKQVISQHSPVKPRNKTQPAHGNSPAKGAYDFRTIKSH